MIWRGAAEASVAGFVLAAVSAAAPTSAQSVEQLKSLSIEQLASIDVTSVTKSSQALSNSAAAIFVISQDDIARSGATTLPEVLRLAPNLEVARRGAADWIITARGMSGNAQAQNFPNKLLVLIDGRSVYSPLYSGVYWDMQDVVLSDIERIEVISGPGATLWGANAVNGVINIITRKAADSQGILAEVTGSSREANASLRYGGRIGADASYRVYARATRGDAFTDTNGTSAQDPWWRVQGGFRIDWAMAARDALTLQGDAYGGITGHPGADETISGRNLTARWTHPTDGGAAAGALQVQAYYDRTMRSTPGSGRFALDTYDLDAQHDFVWGAQHIVWGGGIRASHYDILGLAGLTFAPPRRTLYLGNAFTQDSLTAGPATIILGIKAEDDPYAGISLLPSVRGSLKVGRSLTAWAAVSRAVRSPTPFDTDVVETVGSVVFLTGQNSFRTEKLTAYEAGLRGNIAKIATFSLASYYNVYTDLRSIEPAPGGFLPLQWGNGIIAQTWGLEASATIKPSTWWRLTPGYNWLHENAAFNPGASGLLGTSQIGDDPHWQASLRSAMDLGPTVSVDAALRHVGVRPEPVVPAYTEADLKIAWHVARRVTISVAGQNLLHASHIEYAGGERVPRTLLAGLQWTR